MLGPSLRMQKKWEYPPPPSLGEQPSPTIINTPASKLGYLAPPGNFFMGAKLLIGTLWMRKRGCPQKILVLSMGYVKMHAFYGNPLYIIKKP